VSFTTTPERDIDNAAARSWPWQLQPETPTRAGSASSIRAWRSKVREV
jgi:hypothetical protein